MQANDVKTRANSFMLLLRHTKNFVFKGATVSRPA